MKLKIVIGSVLAIFILSIAAGAYWWLSRPQVIVLGDGTQLTLLAVTYGKHHSLPKMKLNGRKLSGGTMTTTNDSLCVWIDQKHAQNNWPNYQIFAYDPANTACVGNSGMTYGNMNAQQGGEVVGIAFDAFPRHSSKIVLHIQAYNMQNGGRNLEAGKFVVRNPAPGGSYPRWAPEKLPDNQSDGDLQVTLTRFEVDPNGIHMFGGQDKPNDPRSKAILADFRTEQNGIHVTNWAPVQIDTTDATGNHTRNRGQTSHEESGDQVMSYQWGLWPDEPAWKLRVEMSRTSGFAADEMWSASEIPMTNGTMNEIFSGGMRKSKPAAETTLAGNHVQIFPVIKLASDQVRNFGNSMEAMFRVSVNATADGRMTSPPPEGMRLTVVKVTDEAGHPIEFRRWGGMGVGGRDQRFSLKNLGEAKTFNVTLAYHRSRYVEFTVAPAKK